jgi:RimJ/RimL family protein N-acetyltransferase
MLLVDDCTWPHRGRRWCHLVSDTSFEELHDFARSIEMPRVAFQGDHYDLDETRRAAALRAGARPVSGTAIVTALRGAGLRRGPALRRRGRVGVAHLDAPELVTDRLVLRQWTDADVDAAVALNADPEVMAYLGGPLSADETLDQVDENAVNLALVGIGKWALARRDTGVPIGRVGMSRVFHLPMGPALELGWRVHPSEQGRGFATEAARACLAYAQDVLEVDEVVAYTHPDNRASRAVMGRLAMTHDPADDVPGHVVYRWRASSD